MSVWRERRQARRIERLRDQCNDYWDWLWYARLSIRPSQIRKAEERLVKLSLRLDVAEGVR
ncbi:MULTISPECIES: hypothetical protein [unclassified Microbacterium]|uniref:hypothetical protein n=1 Tax=unclassified Microbacterium TaxID=2609290 RepID=UPI000EA9A3A5|nr:MULTISPECIES: hypothetical protein [unclassified Microbacterium]MBT2485791.1 hypothetical protein [Microbacterium sp. ISL-108]RKN68553.1 hypothetical protein D7252_13825 [Microbacterium sp. CGR2]